MENYLWIVWTILGAVLIIAEIFTTGFVLLWFGIGALAAAFAALVGVHSMTAQFLIFALVSIVLTAASRTIFVQYFSRETTGGDLKSGVEGLPGKIGTVVSSSRGALHQGVTGRAQVAIRLCHNLANIFIAQLAGKSITAEQQHVALPNLNPSSSRREFSLSAKGLENHITKHVGLSFFLANLAHVHELLHQRLVLCGHANLLTAHYVSAAVSHLHQIKCVALDCCARE